MAKKKNGKKKDKKIAAKDKAREKAKALKATLKEKAKKEKVKLKEKARKEKSKAKAKAKEKVKDKVKKTKSKGKNPEPATSPETGKDKRGTTGRAVSEAKTSGTSSMSVNARTAVTKIRSLGKAEAINEYIAEDQRVTVKEAAESKIASLSGK